MNFVFALTVGLLFAGGVYLILRRAWLKTVLGIAIIGHAVNLLIFSFGGAQFGRAAIMDADQVTLSQPYADPLPQALILTAIVIGFGMQAFLVALFKRAYQSYKVEDLDQLEES